MIEPGLGREIDIDRAGPAASSLTEAPSKAISPGRDINQSQHPTLLELLAASPDGGRATYSKNGHPKAPVMVAVCLHK